MPDIRPYVPNPKTERTPPMVPPQTTDSSAAATQQDPRERANVVSRPGPTARGARPQPKAMAMAMEPEYHKVGATTESRGDMLSFMADEEGWEEDVPPIVVNMETELGEGWEEDVPPMVVNMERDLGESWEDGWEYDVVPMGEDVPHNDYPTVAEFMANIPEQERMNPVGKINFCTNNEVAQAVSRQFSGAVIVDFVEEFITCNNVPMAEECSFYLDSEDDCEAMIEALLPAATALEDEGTDVHIAILEDGRFNFLKNGTFERWSNPENELRDEDEDDDFDQEEEDECGDDESAESVQYEPEVEEPEQDEEIDNEGAETLDDENVKQDEHNETDQGSPYPAPVRLKQAHGPRYERMEYLPPVLRNMITATANSVQVAIESALVFQEFWEKQEATTRG